MVFAWWNLVLASTFWMITRWLLIWTQLSTGTRYTLDVAPIMFHVCGVYKLCYKYLIHQSQDGENFQQNHDPFCCLRRLPLRLGNISLESWKSGSQTLNVWYVLPTFTIEIGQIQVYKYTSAIEYLGMDWRCKTFSQMRVSSVWKDTSIWRIHEPDSLLERFGWTFQGWTWVKMVSFEVPSRMTSKHLRRFGV